MSTRPDKEELVLQKCLKYACSTFIHFNIVSDECFSRSINYQFFKALLSCFHKLLYYHSWLPLDYNTTTNEIHKIMITFLEFTAIALSDRNKDNRTKA